MPPFLLGGDDMKFQGKPNLTIVDYKRLVAICTFDENGFFETDDPNKIKYLTTKTTSAKVVEEQPKVTPKEEKPQEVPAEKVYKCKKCGYTTTNMGELLAHYRTKHPKEG
jgi:hypothetical protein